MINERRHTREALNAFARRVIRKARANKLSAVGQSLEHELSSDEQGLFLDFKALPYAPFLDEGVRGADPSNISPNARITGQQAPRSQYRFGSGNFAGTFGEFRDNILQFVRKKRLRFRDDKGKFKIGNQKSLAYIIAGNIYNRGLRPTLFFTEPFDEELAAMPELLEIAIGRDIDDNMDEIFGDRIKE